MVVSCVYLFIFSPSGKLVQIEYALAAVAAGAPSVGIKGNVCIVDILYGRRLVHKKTSVFFTTIYNFISSIALIYSSSSILVSNKRSDILLMVTLSKQVIFSGHGEP